MLTLTPMIHEIIVVGFIGAMFLFFISLVVGALLSARTK